MKILLLFIDGVGVGENDPIINPCAQPQYQFFSVFRTDSFPKPVGSNGIGFGIDANLGVDGLPQSATGQTAILTGINSAKILTRHLNGYPNETLRKILAEHSILKFFNELGWRTAFINTYRPPFFDYNPFDIVKWLSATSIANLFAGLKYFNLDDLKAERSIYQEFTNNELRHLGFDVPIFTPTRAGTILARACQEYDFCLYEYFQTDIAGHSQDMAKARREIDKLEEFLKALLRQLDLSKHLVLLVSDHGNIEDLSTKSHTKNPALAVAWGLYKNAIFEKLKSITDVTIVLKEIASSYLNGAITGSGGGIK